MSAPLDLIEDLTLAAPEVPRAFPSWWWTLPLLALLLVAFLWLRRRRRLHRVAVIPADKTALTELATLLAALDSLDARTFALRLSSLLRVYIENRFGLRAPHRSTEEFLLEARSSPLLSAEQQAWIAAFLLHCDQAKFALAGLETAAKHALHDEALRFVRATTPSA